MEKYFDCILGPFNLNDTERIGIVSAEQWFQGVSQTIMEIYIDPDDFVVGRWFEFSDGVTDHAEGFTTIAICKELTDANTLVQERVKDI
jgi:hypothetical protein